MWVCKNHGKHCRSYVRDIAERYNRMGYRPDRTDEIPPEDRKWLFALKWEE